MPRVAKLEPKKDPSGSWVLNIPAAYSDTGKRRRAFFDTKALAQAEADKIKRERKQWGNRAKHVEPHLVTEAVAAAKLLQPYGVSLLEATRQWVERQTRLEASETVEEACMHYESLKEDEGRTGDYLTSLRSLRRKLPEEFLSRKVSDIEPSDVEEALDATTTGITQWNLKRRQFRAIIEDSVRRGKAPANPVSRVLNKRNSKAHRIDILTLDEAQSLLSACSGISPAPRGRASGKPLELADALPAVAVALFAGLRPEEVRRVDWSQIDLEEQVIRLEGDDTKTRRRRHVDITDNLAAWLEPHARAEGRLIPIYWTEKWTAIRAKVGISDRQDVTRHTYGSAWWAIHRDIHQLSFQMGNSPEVCRTHYLEHMPKRDALKYWEIMPEGKEAPKMKAV